MFESFAVAKITINSQFGNFFRHLISVLGFSQHEFASAIPGNTKFTGIVSVRLACSYGSRLEHPVFQLDKQRLCRRGIEVMLFRLGV
jgi:hypothetical protein